MKDNDSKTVGTSHPRSASPINNHTPLKASTIKLGIDVHKFCYVVVAQWEHATPKPPQRFKPQEFPGWVRKLREEGHEVHSVYEASGFGFRLHRQLDVLGVHSLVIAPHRLEEPGTRVKTDAVDARQLCLRLDRYVCGNRGALAAIRVPTVEEEQRRTLGRQRAQLLRRRTQMEAEGRSLLRLHGIDCPRQWWHPLRWSAFQRVLPEWIGQRLECLQPVLVALHQRVEALTKELEQAAKDRPMPSGVGALSDELLSREVCDWSRFSNRKQIAAYTGLCPSEYSSGQSRRQGSITKHGNPRVRHLLIEMAWRLLSYQPDYHAWAKWKPILNARHNSPAARKKIVVAVARQLAIDLWRLHTGRATPQDLGLTLTTNITRLRPMKEVLAA